MRNTIIKNLPTLNVFMILAGVLVFMTEPVHGQDLSKTRLSLYSTQLPSSVIQLDVKLLGRVDKRYQPLSDCNVLFYNISTGENELLGEAKTDKRGLTKLKLEDTGDWELNEDGLLVFSAEFEGKEGFKPSDNEVEIRRAILAYETFSDEAGNRISLKAKGADSLSAPLAEYEVKMSVPRMYSDLIVAEDYTDEEGNVEFEFPDGIPGDESGNLDLKVRILDADEYGNLEVNLSQKWGVPKEEVVEENRQLWSPDAPFWMVVTFAVLMLAVWAHFGIAGYNLYRLKSLGKD